MDFNADLPAFYADFKESILGVGEPFDGLIDTADQDVFGTAVGTTHTLRYLAGTVLTTGAVLTVATGNSAGTYKVLGVPKRIAPGEYLADLVMVKQ